MTSIGALGATDGVERGADGTPSAFRIWRAGANPTDHGVHKFTEKSADYLMAQQKMRGNEFSVDVDHMSLNEKSPPEARKAVGFHKLAIRDTESGPELWAVECRWTETVRMGLAAEVPDWKYFSPAYDVDKKTGEITRYLNTALTNNPATWSVTALASAGGTERKMGKKYENLLKDAMGEDPEKKNAALAAFAAAFPDEGEEEDPEGKKKEEKAAKASAEKEEEAKKAAAAKATAEEEEKKAAQAKAEEEMKQAKTEEARASLALARKVSELEATIAADRATAAKEKEDTVRASLFAKRPDFSESQRTILSKLPITDVEAAVKDWPRVVADPKSTIKANLAGGGNSTEVRATSYTPRLDPEQQRILANVFGKKDDAPMRATVSGTTLFMPMRTPTQAEARARLKELDAELEAIHKEMV